LKGELGAVLLAVSKSGERLAEWKLDSLPVFDALAAANGKLYYSAMDGTVRCMAGAQNLANAQ
jgi:hypothetical protein